MSWYAVVLVVVVVWLVVAVGVVTILARVLGESGRRHRPRDGHERRTTGSLP